MRWSLLALALLWGSVEASGLIMARSRLPFEQTLTTLRSSLESEGYQIARVQTLAAPKSGPSPEASDYRLVFFGDKHEMDQMVSRYPSLAAYLPWKLAVFAERSQTLVVSIHPQQLKQLFPQAKTEPAFRRLEQSLKRVFARLRQQD